MDRDFTIPALNEWPADRPIVQMLRRGGQSAVLRHIEIEEGSE